MVKNMVVKPKKWPVDGEVACVDVTTLALLGFTASGKRECHGLILFGTLQRICH